MSSAVRVITVFLALVVSALSQLQHTDELFVPIPPTPNATADELYRLGTHAYEADLYRTAIVFLEQATRLSPKHKLAWVNLGRAYMMLDRFSDAERAFRKAIEINPFDEWAYNNLGRPLMVEDREEEAVAAFRKHLEINPLDIYAHENIGNLRAQQGDCAAAIEELEIALKLKIGDDGKRYLIACYRAMHRGDDAAQVQRLLRRTPTDPIDRFLWSTRSPQRILIWAMEGLAMLPPDAGIEEQLQKTSATAAYWAVIGQSYLRMGELDKAQAFLEPAWNLTRSTAVAELLGRTYELRKQWVPAATWYAMSAMGIYPQDIGSATYLKIKPEIQSKVIAPATERFEHAAQISLKFMHAPSISATIVVQQTGQKVSLASSGAIEPMRSELEKALLFAVPPGYEGTLTRRGTLSCASDRCEINLVPLPNDILNYKFKVRLSNTAAKR